MQSPAIELTYGAGSVGSFPRAARIEGFMGLLNPDMRSDEIRLHMGELTADELRVARAAIRWANSAHDIDGLIAEVHDCIGDSSAGNPIQQGRRLAYNEGVRAAISIIRKHFGKE